MSASKPVEEPEPEPTSQSSTSETDADSPDSTEDATAKKPSIQIVRNLTINKLHIVNSRSEVVVLAPLEERHVDVGRWPVEALEEMELVSRSVEEQSTAIEALARLLSVAFVVGFIGFGVVDALADSNPAYQWQIWVGAVALYLLAIGIAVVFLMKQEAVASRLLAQALTLLLVLAISVFLPMAVVLQFADEEISELTGVDVFVRVTQVAIISLAAMLPGLLFFFFDRQKLSTLRNRFERQIFRLDPNVRTLADVYARYGRQLEETYGATDSRQGNRLARQRRWPILLATLVLTLGWITAIAPVGVLSPELKVTDIPEVLAPRPHPVAFGFLGSYFYAINLIWRRYTRGDLRPKAYSAITVRVLTVLVVTWVLAATVDLGDDLMLVGAFLIGIVPETVFVLWRETVSGGQSLLPSFKALEERQPLQELEGVDLYDRARLQDEGISNVQALAHHELVDLLLETRIPAGRLVDWVDQAILYMHCSGQESGSLYGGCELLRRLKDVGVRTASDFEVTMSNTDSREGLLALTWGDGETLQESVLAILLTSLRDDEWMSYVRHWRHDSPVNDVAVHLSEDCRTIAVSTLDSST